MRTDPAKTIQLRNKYASPFFKLGKRWDGKVVKPDKKSAIFLFTIAGMNGVFDK